MVLKLRINRCEGNQEMEGQGLPVSPLSQAVSNCLNIVFEFEESITDISRGKKIMADALLPRNPRFCSIMKRDDRGVLRWQKTTVNTDDHILIAEFPPGEESYDAWVDDYISKLAFRPLDQSRPLWEVHFLDYKTAKAGATVVVRLHQALGDGISLMSTFFTIVTRVDNPDLPPTFPTPKRSNKSSPRRRSDITLSSFLQRLWYMMLVVWYTFIDVISSYLTMEGWIDDSQLPIRRPAGVEDMAGDLSSATFRLEDIKRIKESVGGTVNDVITGIIFYGMQRYLQIRLSAVGDQYGLQDADETSQELSTDAIIKQMKKSRLTALYLLNMRALTGVQNIDEMLKPKAQAPSGNNFGFLPLRMPMMGKREKPLEFVRRVKLNIDRHKMSLGVFINARLLRYLARWKGPQAISRYLKNTLTHTTTRISSLIGPMEKVAMDGNPIKNFYFYGTGTPQALGVYIVTYNGAVVLQVHAQKPYVDAKIMSTCFTEAFEEIVKDDPKSNVLGKRE